MLSHKKNKHNNCTHYTLLHTSSKQHKMQFTSGSSSKIMLTDLSTVHYLLLRIPKDTLISLDKFCLFPVCVSPCPVLSHIMSQQFLPPYHLSKRSWQYFAAVPETADNRSHSHTPKYAHNRILCNT